MTREEKAIRNEQMKAYKAEGHTMSEVAERFGVKKSTAQMICKGIAPQWDRCYLYNQYTDGTFDRIENCKRIIARYNPELEYVGNFKDVDSPVDVRCKVCGYVFSRSLISFRKHDRKINCPACEEVRKQKEKEQKQIAEEQARIERLKQSEQRRRERKIERMLAKSHTQSAMKFCPVCNTVFVGSNTYCSEHCRNQNKWMMKEGYRHKFPLEELYKRDNGICYLCGKPCDLNDKHVVNGVVVYGNNYPSRDHVIPKSQGGENSWDNLKLAHRLCNSLKSDSPIVNRTDVCS